MNLQFLINQLPTYSKAEALQFTSENSINIEAELPNEISIVLDSLLNNKALRLDELINFTSTLSSLDKKINHMILFHLHEMIKDIYLKHQANISIIVRTIEDATIVPEDVPSGIENYYGLLNGYLLLSQVLYLKGWMGHSYPGIMDYQSQILFDNIPFSINALKLSGKLPRDGVYGEINLSAPLYPIGVGSGNEEKIPSKKGIKKSEEFFPFKRVSKIATGDTGDVVFLATNGTKILYVRGLSDYTPNSVLASKVATLVSPKHFSSERLLDNHLIASAKFPNYALSVADARTRTERKRLIETDCHVFPGSGIIDEVTNFVGETDYNIENFGFSSTDIASSHLTKIDFDRCNVIKKLKKETYEQDILTKPVPGIYHAAEHVGTNSQYLAEKLYTRLKLSMLSEELISGLASKAFLQKDEEYKQQAIAELFNRTGIAFELFIEHSQSKQFLIANPYLINQSYSEVLDYIDKHFDVEDRQVIKESIAQRVALLTIKLNKTLSLSLPEINDKSDNRPYYSNFIGKAGNMDEASSPPLSRERSLPTEADLLIPKEGISSEADTKPGFFSRNKWKLAGIVALSLIGLGVGIALTATGVLAPLGAGIIGLTVAGAVGLGGGLLVGSATLGADIGYNEYRYRKNIDSSNSDKTVASSIPQDPRQSSLRNLEQDSRRVYESAINSSHQSNSLEDRTYQVPASRSNKL